MTAQPKPLPPSARDVLEALELYGPLTLQALDRVLGGGLNLRASEQVLGALNLMNFGQLADKQVVRQVIFDAGEYSDRLWALQMITPAGRAALKEMEKER